jgi:hypothetical protein
MHRRDFHFERPLLKSQVLRAVGEVELYLTLFITCSGGI